MLGSGYTSSTQAGIIEKKSKNKFPEIIFYRFQEIYLLPNGRVEGLV